MEGIQEVSKRIEAQNPSDARALLSALPADSAAEILLTVGSARVLELLEGAEQQSRLKILALLPTHIREQWESNSQYPVRTVGRFIDPTRAVFQSTDTVENVVETLRSLVKSEFVTYGFVTDNAGRLFGILAMRELLFAAPTTQVSDIMIPNPFSLSPHMPLEDAMRAVVRRHFPVYPVINERGELLGTVRGARLFEAQAIEISAQPGAMVGVEKEERLSTHWPRSFKLRHPWLQINLFTAFLAGAVVSAFQGTIDQLVILASFLPVLAGQSGNTGCQALAVTIRGVTLGDYQRGAWIHLVRKEALLGVVNGFFVGLVAGAGMYLMASAQHQAQPWLLSAVVVCAMMGSCVISGVAGVLVPVALRRFGFDPATASSIFLTTATDVASMGMLLGLATAFVV